jgi:Cu-Zn family superoxide dismutase
MKRQFMSLAVAGAVVALAIMQTPADSAQQTGQHGADVESAVALLSPTSVGGQVQGKVTFVREGRGVRVKGRVSGLKPGKHGFHIHEFGDVTSPDGKAAGAHFNPTGEPHGGHDSAQRHVGDFGNIEANAQGVAEIDFVDERLRFDGPTSILGRGLIVHADPDDLKTQPSGAAGDRVAQGVIGVAASPTKSSAAK